MLKYTETLSLTFNTERPLDIVFRFVFHSSRNWCGR